MATRIKHVTVKRLWGIKNIATSFDEHVNIFIGSNGSSKTTFLNLIEATLRCHVNTLAEIDFESIEILLDEDESIQVFKINREDGAAIQYSFNHDYPYELMCEEPSYRSRNFIKQRESIYRIQEELSKLVNISWLSINRENSEFSEREFRQDIDIIRNMVDLKLKDLVKKLTIYRLQLEQEANKSAAKFKEECLSLMLFNESVDVLEHMNLNQISKNTDAESMKRDLYGAFKALGVVKDKREQINTHINQIKDVLSKIKEKEDLELDDFFLLPLINRSLSIIRISRDHEEQTKQIFAPIEKFWKCLKGFMPDKSFELNKDNTGGLSILLKEDRDKPVSIGITSLSSGEKQLFILLTEVLLQKMIPHIFIADEPELSLHIAWQKRIIGAILELNPKAQIVVATHSPEVAADYRGNLINMKTITSYE